MTNSVRDERGIKAIETRYAGCHFRSRLEARWAVFFDHLGIRWEYEPQGFVGARGTNYLPDFLLPEIAPPVRSHRMGDEDGRYEPEMLGTFVEVKGTDKQLRIDADRIGATIDYRETPIAHGLLILGPVPDASDNRIGEIAHSFLSWHKGVDHTVVRFELMYGPDPAHGRAMLGGRLNEPTPRLAESSIGRYYQDGTSESVPNCAQVDAFLFPHELTRGVRPDPKVIAAYTAARSARFEHGQSGAA